MTATDLAWLLAACALLVGLCMALSCADWWLDYLTSRRRMWRHVHAALRDAAQRDTDRPMQPPTRPVADSGLFAINPEEE